MPDDKPIDDKTLPALASAAEAPALLPSTMSPAMSIMLDDKLFERAKLVAKYISEAEGFVPPHLLGKTAACFAVVTRALTWKLDPYAVAQSTYQTPGGKVGYEGKLCQAILENSGKLEGPVEYELFGAWEKVRGKFSIVKSDKGKDYAKPTWTRADAQGCGVIVSAQVRGEAKRRVFKFFLEQAFPLNSTLWATDPETQIKYAAVRRFGSVAAPGLFMGVPFDRDDLPGDRARDITPPRPKRSDFQNGDVSSGTASATETQGDEVIEETFEITTSDGEVLGFEAGEDAIDALTKALEDADRTSGDALDGLWESNGLLLTQLRERGMGERADGLHAAYSALVAKREKARSAPQAEPPSPLKVTGRADGRRER